MVRRNNVSTQIDIKLKRFLWWCRKHPLKQLCLKCHIWWEIYKTNFLLEFIPQVSILLISIVIDVMQDVMCNRFSLFSCDPDGRSISNFYRFVSLCLDYTKSLHCQQLFVSKNQFCNVPLKPLYTLGKQYCPSPTLSVSQLIYNNKPVKI